MALVSFDSFLREFKVDFQKLCKEYPPGPTVQDLVDWYGETRFRCERVVQWCERQGIVARIVGPGRRVYVVSASKAVVSDDKYHMLTNIQRQVLLEIVRLAQLQESDQVRYTVMGIAENTGVSNGAVAAALRRLSFYGLIQMSTSYDKKLHKAVLDLKIDH